MTRSTPEGVEVILVARVKLSSEIYDPKDGDTVSYLKEMLTHDRDLHLFSDELGDQVDEDGVEVHAMTIRVNGRAVANVDRHSK